jgi:hypothetical protein
MGISKYAKKYGAYTIEKIKYSFNLFLQPFRDLNELEKKLEEANDNFNAQTKRLKFETKKFKTILAEKGLELGEIKQDLASQVEKLETTLAEMESKSGKYTKQ